MDKLPLSRKNRLYFIEGLFILALFGLIAQAIRLQVLERDYLVRRSSGMTERNYRFDGVRGEILDSRGEKLAATVPVEAVFIDSQAAKDLGSSLWPLYRALKVDYEDLALTLEQDRRNIYLKRNLSSQEAAAVRALKLSGVALDQGSRRDYPNGPLAAHLLGFVSRYGEALEGLELTLDAKLSGKSRKFKVRRDVYGRIMVDSPELVVEQPKGASAVLTLDMRIQNIAERSIAKAVIEHSAKSGMALVVRPSTGEILASAVFPGFDPNDYAASPLESRRNRILTDVFEPGSVFKIFTVAAALEENLVTPQSVFFCENGVYQIDANHFIRDDGAAYGDLTVSEIVQHSSNIGASKIGERLGSAKLHNYISRFAFGQKTGLAFQTGEAAGRLRPPSEWHVIDLATGAFGQGLSVSALQLIMATAAIGHDGVLMRPYLVSKIVAPDGEVLESFGPQIVRQVVSPMTAKQVMAMMRLAVMRGGTGFRADIEDYPVAGKTATGQKVSEGANTYSKNKYVASFVGLAPYYDPQLCVLVVLDEPWPDYYGGKSAAPVFREIMSQALPLLDVPVVEEPAPPAWPALEQANSGAPGVLTKYPAYNTLSVKLKPGDKGRGRLPDLWTDDRAPEIEFDRLGGPEGPVELRPPEPDGTPGVMPDLAGLSMREVLRLMGPYGLTVEFQGSGLAVGQEPASGALVESGQLAKVRFSEGS
ncbi:MAG: transpeptidase family protein [Deltaproteobacteria bacterium]|nr:transpeptidase family protein [Deltaproteobacteria bacterium]